jgi:NADPH:quinone reductase-like Zn-dependent oxidoreductase
VGTFAVQIAKAFGAEVTGVCSTRNVEMVASIGADHVVDYTQQDFTQVGQRYDLLVDAAGNRTLSECRRVLTPRGILVGVGDRPVIDLVKMLVFSSVVSQRMAPLLGRQRRDDLAVLRELVEDRKVTPVIDRTYPLNKVPEAIRYLEHGHARGKVVITV